jgi:hypothetical protein
MGLVGGDWMRDVCPKDDPLTARKVEKSCCWKSPLVLEGGLIRPLCCLPGADSGSDGVESLKGVKESRWEAECCRGLVRGAGW